MGVDKKTKIFQSVNSKLSLIVFPVHYLVDMPFRLGDWLMYRIATEHQLVSDNTELRAQNVLLQSKLQQMLAIRLENAQLRTLLQSKSHVGGQVRVAQLLAVDLDPSLQQVVIDKGKGYNLYIGQPVLDAYGVMGQVVHVGAFTSKVVLLTDAKSAIPVENQRNATRAIAVGMGSSGLLELINLPATSEVKKDDLFVSSGLGLRYPVGYPVGVVMHVERDPSARFITVILKPSAHLSQSRQVLLAWPNHFSLLPAVRKELKSKIPEV